MWPIIWREIYDITTLPIICLMGSCWLGARHWQRLPASLKWMVMYLFFNLAIEIAARAASILWGQNLPLLHLYTVGECILLSLFYHKILDEESVFQRYFKWIVGITILLVVLNTIFLQSIFEFNSYGKTLVQLLIILFSLDYAFRFSEQTNTNIQLSRSIRLINSAVLIYYCGSLFVFMSSQFEIETRGALQILWDFNTVLNLFFQIVVFIGLWKVLFQPQKLSSSSA